MDKLGDYLTRYDKLLIISLVILGVLGIFLPYRSIGEKSNMVIIIQNADREEKRIPIVNTYGAEPLLIPVNGPLGISIIEAYNGKVRMKEAPVEDPLKVCEKTGWIDQPGPMIICIPNQISIWIEKEESELDGVSY